jgi:Tfp pilus assembly protein PilN
MRAVNLIPAESKVGGRSGMAPYILLGVLAVLLAGVAYYVLTSNSIVDRKAKLAALENQTQAAQQQAQAVQPYQQFASLAQARVQTIRQLGQARFDWQRALSDLSKVMPDNVWLSSLTATVAPGVSIGGGGGGGGGGTTNLRGALPNPAFEISGCTTDHDSVVRFISRLRLMDGVQRVALADSQKGDSSSSGGGSGGSTGGDCRHGHGNFPAFDLVVFFDPIPALPAPSAPGASPASGAPAAAGAATPAASTTPTAPPQGTTPAPAPASAATTPSSGSSGTPGASGGTR